MRTVRVRHGAGHPPGLRPWIHSSARGRPVAVGFLGRDILGFDRSDYDPLRSQGRFRSSSSRQERTHATIQPEDTSETVNYAKLTSISQMIYQVVRQSRRCPCAVPRWQKNQDDPFAEAVTIRDVLATARPRTAKN